MTNQMQFHQIFPYLSTAIQIVSQNFPIRIYKQLHTTLILLTEITMLKHVVYKMLKTHYTGKRKKRVLAQSLIL